MITVGFSTRKKDEEYIKHIKQTIGLKNVEIICYENNNEYSLTQLYNKILEQARYNIVVLIHDDLFFQKKGWGKPILSFFNNSDYGILGLAGTTHLNERAVWWETPKNMCGRVFHKKKNIFDEIEVKQTDYSLYHNHSILDVAVIDGLFMAINKEKIASNFNEKITGFHFYDISFCIDNLKNNVKIGVINHSLLNVTHDSVGEVNNQWHLNRNLFIKMYSDVLPMEIQPKINYVKKDINIKKEPRISIIIPTKNNYNYLEGCILSIFEKTNYLNFDIFIADTGSNKEVLDKYNDLLITYDNIKIIEYDYYNFAEINNDVVENHIPTETELLLFCNDDIELINDAISLMVRKYVKNKRHIGTLGANMFFENNLVQHSGIGLFLKDKMIFPSNIGYKTSYYYHQTDMEVLGNTGAFLMINKNLFNKIGKFTKTTECFEDVLLNMECLKRNRINALIGDAFLYHYESISRNKNKDKYIAEGHDLEKFILPEIKNNLKYYKKYIKSL